MLTFRKSLEFLSLYILTVYIIFSIICSKDRYTVFLPIKYTKGRDGFMTFTLNTPMFDFLVLSIIAEGDAYGYQISQIIKRVSDTKDSALYPILKKLQENGYVETYDQQFQGRNRKYYKITQSGKIRQEHLKRNGKSTLRSLTIL